MVADAEKIKAGPVGGPGLLEHVLRSLVAWSGGKVDK